jgi:hypothetical protein
MRWSSMCSLYVLISSIVNPARFAALPQFEIDPADGILSGE